MGSLPPFPLEDLLTGAQKLSVTDSQLQTLISRAATEATLAALKGLFDAGSAKVSADDGALASIGAKADAVVTDPTLSASEIALLKGLLKQLQGTGPVVTPVSLNGSSAPDTQPIPAKLVASKATPVTIMLNAATVSGASSWVPCSGYNRAIVLLQASSGWARKNGSIVFRGRADTDVATLPLYLMNTALAFWNTAVLGYYEVDVNPLTDVQVYANVPSGESVTVKAWFSSTPFVPDVPSAAIKIYDAVAITDTNPYQSPTLSGIGVRRSRLIVKNTHDQAVDVRITENEVWWSPLRKFSDNTFYELIVPANTGPLVIESSDFPPLGGPLPANFIFQAFCTVAPTTGSLTALWVPEAM